MALIGSISLDDMKRLMITVYHKFLRQEIMLSSMQNSRKQHAKWVEFLEQFAYVIKHKQGKANVVVDLLSRRCSLVFLLETKLLSLIT